MQDNGVLQYRMEGGRWALNYSVSHYVANGTAISSSDGFLKDGHRGVGWKLAIHIGALTAENIQEGAASVDRAVNDLSSTRC